MHDFNEKQSIKKYTRNVKSFCNIHGLGRVQDSKWRNIIEEGIELNNLCLMTLAKLLFSHFLYFRILIKNTVINNTDK